MSARRRRIFAWATLAVLVVSLIASAVPALAHEGDEEGPAPVGSSPTGIVVFPPIVKGAADGVRVYVRTSAVNPTEYLLVRQEIVDAGFPDVLEVSPGSFIVGLDGVSLDEAIIRLMEVDKVTEVVQAPAYDSSSTTDSMSYPSWWLLLPVALSFLASALFISRRIQGALADHRDQGVVSAKTERNLDAKV